MTKKTKKINNTQKKTKKNTKTDFTIYRTPFESFEKKVEKKELIKSNKKNELRDKNFLHFIKEKKTIQPNQDYYSYINNYWTKDMILTKKENYLTNINDVTLIQNKVFQQINDIYLDVITKMSIKEVINMRTFYNSAYKLNLPEQSKENIIECIEMIDNFRKYSLQNKLWKFLATINKNTLVNTLCPIRFRMDPNEKDYKIYCPYIHPVIFPIDQKIFVNDNINMEYKQQIRHLYKKYIDDLCIQCIGSHHNINSQDILDVFIDIQLCFKETDNRYNHNNGYNMISSEDSLLVYNFNWEEFTKELGFSKIPDFFVTHNVTYFKNITSLLLQEWNSEKWRSYWIFIYMIQINKFTKNWKDLTFDIDTDNNHDKKYEISDEIYAINLTLIAYNQLLTKLYKEKYYQENGIFYIENLSKDLRLVFYRMIQNNTWLQNDTKKNALLKLDYLNIIIGNYEEEKSYNDPDLNYTNNIWLNITNYLVWRFNELLELNGKKIINFPIVDWSKNNISFQSNEIFIVKINYTPLSNTIFIPLACIQKPFLDLEEAGIEYNLPYMGFKIAQTLSCVIADKGALFDYNGNLNAWWSEKDDQKYTIIKQDIQKQYNQYIKKDHFHLTPDILMNKAHHINETVYDIAGLYICQEYLCDFQEMKELPNIIRKGRMPDFYAFFANQMKQININTKEKKVNSFRKYKTNLALSRLDIFKTYYNIKEGDGMYWHNTKNIW